MEIGYESKLFIYKNNQKQINSQHKCIIYKLMHIYAKKKILLLFPKSYQYHLSKLKQEYEGE